MLHPLPLFVRRTSPLAVMLGWLAVIAGLSPTVADQPPADTNTAERQSLLKEMRSAVVAIKIAEMSGDHVRAAKLVDEPIFRYSDEPRQIRDATMWVWLADGRPVSLMKVERYGFPDPRRRWLFNAASISPETVQVTWPFDREFVSKKPGMTFQRMPDAPPAAEGKAARLTQLKQLSRRFAATMLGGATDESRSEMRLLTTPLSRFASEASQILDGALFGFSSTGTNPDAILAIQLRGESVKSAEWQYAVTGMTTGGLQVRLNDKQVWSQPLLVGQGQLFETWTWFFSESAE